MTIYIYSSDAEIAATISGIAGDRFVVRVCAADDPLPADGLVVIDAAMTQAPQPPRGTGAITALLAANPYLSYAEAFGADAVLAKPLSSEAIQALLAGALERERREGREG